MPYLVDTDIIVYLMQGNKKIDNQMEAVGEKNVFISSLSVGELYFGAFNSGKIQTNLANLQNYLEDQQILNFTKSTARIFGRIKTEMRKKGNPISDFDLAIASIALYHNCILVTHNTRHFQNIPELTVIDWY